MQFVHALSLVGLAGAGVPIILHLIRYKRREQVIPSLLLFTVSGRLRTQRRLKDIWLLLLRILACVLLAFLLARPYLRSHDETIRLDEAPDVAIGIVLDDGICAYQGVGGQPALAVARATALECLESVSADAKVVVATTASGTCTKPLSVDEAKRLLQRVARVPLPGDGKLAVRRAAERLRSLKGVSYAGIVLACPGNADLWSSQEALPPDLPAINALPMFFKPANNRIESVRYDSELKDLNVRLATIAGGVRGGRIVVQNHTAGTAMTIPLTVSDYAMEAKRIPMGEHASPTKLTILLEEPGASLGMPLNVFFWASGSAAQSRCFVIRYRDREQDVTAARILQAALDSLALPNTTILASAIGATSPSTPPEDAEIVAFVVGGGDADLSAKTMETIRKRGGRVVIVASATDTVDGFDTPVCTTTPTRLELSKNHHPQCLEIYGKGLMAAKVRQACPVVADTTTQALLTFEGRSVVAMTGSADDHILVHWGIPLCDGNLPFITNPLFPALLQLVAMGFQDLPCNDCNVGEHVWPEKILGGETGQWELHAPDGALKQCWDLSSDCAEPELIESGGFYTCRPAVDADNAADEKTIAANLRRPSGQVLSTAGCNRIFPSLIRCATVDEVILSDMGGPATTAGVPVVRRQDRDLTGLIFFTLWWLVLIEMGVSTFLVGRGKPIVEREVAHAG